MYFLACAYNVVLHQLGPVVAVVAASLQLDVVHQTLQGRQPGVARLQIIFKYPGVGWKVNNLLHVEVPGDLCHRSELTNNKHYFHKRALGAPSPAAWTPPG